MTWRFCKWFFRGLEADAGWRLFLNRWLVLQIICGAVLALLIKEPPQDAARFVGLPLISIFVGVSLVWVGVAQALLQEKEIEKLSEYHPDGMETYVYTFQLAVLIILVTLSAWGLAALGVFSFLDSPCGCNSFWIESALYFLACVTLHECWNVVKAAQLLILCRIAIRESERKQ